MMKDKFATIPRRALMCVVMGGIFVLAGCSGGGSPPQGSASETGAGPVTPAAPPANEDAVWLAKLMASEAGSISDVGQAVRATDAERSAVAWTALNRVKAGSFGKSVRDVVTAAGQFAYDKEPTSEILDLAGRLQKGQIPDPTSGATHFFSPIGMPKEEESTAGFDVGGGLHVVPGLGKKVYFPSWTAKLAWVGELQDVRQKYYMFYRPSGASPGSPGVGGSSQPRVVFQSRDRSQILIANADGTGIRLIANGDSPIDNVIWSPDGEKLAYTTVTVDKGNVGQPVNVLHLWLLTSWGKPVELRRVSELHDDYVAFAPDSAHLLFADEGTRVDLENLPNNLYVVKWDGTSKAKIGKQGFRTTPEWSPDGSRIAYVNEFYNLIVVNNDGTQTQRLVPNVHQRVGWSPDGRRILFGDGFIELPSGVVTKLLSTDTRSKVTEPQFSPDGGMVAYYFRDQSLRVVAVNQAGEIGPEIAYFSIGSRREIVGDHGQRDQLYSWSPDGQKILVNQGSFLGGPAYHVFDVRSGKAILLLQPDPKRDSCSSGAGPWSDDGKLIVFYQNCHVYVVNSDGTGRIDLGAGESPQWSPDGKKITYGQTETFGQEVVGQYIFVVNPDGTGKVKIAEGINPRWIPASSW